MYTHLLKSPYKPLYAVGNLPVKLMVIQYLVCLQSETEKINTKKPRSQEIYLSPFVSLLLCVKSKKRLRLSETVPYCLLIFQRIAFEYQQDGNENEI